MRPLVIMQLPLPDGRTMYGVIMPGEEDRDDPIIIGFPTEARAREYIALVRSGASADVLVDFMLDIKRQ